MNPVEVSGQSKPNTTCPKCGAGSLSLYQFVHTAELRRNPLCLGCPPTEHLHVSCEHCGYTIWTSTADAPPMVEETPPIEEPPPIEQPPPVEEPPLEVQPLDAASTGRHKKPRGG